MNIYKIELGHITPGVQIFTAKDDPFINLAKKKINLGKPMYRINLSKKNPPIISMVGTPHIEDGTISYSEKGKIVIGAQGKDLDYKIVLVGYKNLKTLKGYVKIIYVGNRHKFWVVKIYPGSSFEAWNQTKADGSRESKIFTFDEFN